MEIENWKVRNEVIHISDKFGYSQTISEDGSKDCIKDVAEVYAMSPKELKERVNLILKLQDMFNALDGLVTQIEQHGNPKEWDHFKEAKEIIDEIRG